MISTAGITPLKAFDVSQQTDLIKQLQTQAKAFSKIGELKVPGIPDVKGLVKKLVDSEAKKVLEECRKHLLELIIMIMSGALLAMNPAEALPLINGIVTILNAIISGISVIVMTLIAVAIGVFAIIIGLVITMVITKILGMIPSIAIAFGTGISLDSFKVVCNEIILACQTKLKEMWPIAFKVVSRLFNVIKIYAVIKLVYDLLSMFLNKQNKSKDVANSAMSKSAEDWDNILGKTDDTTTGDAVTLVECKLPDGTTKKLTPEECLSAGGTWGDMGLVFGYNECLIKLRKCEDENPGSEQCLKQKIKCDELCVQLGDLCGYQFNENIIPSLLNIHDEVTVEDIIENKGKRYGFYQDED